jgi:sec-independent protein translocase protein TatB
MFNVTGGEFFMILVVALIVLGPERLPAAARRIGEVVGQLRDLSDNFKREVAQAMDDPDEPIVKPMSRPRLTALEGGAAQSAPTPPAEPPSAEPRSAEPSPADARPGTEASPGADTPSSVAAASTAPAPAVAEYADPDTADPEHANQEVVTGDAAPAGSVMAPYASYQAPPMPEPDDLSDPAPATPEGSPPAVSAARPVAEDEDRPVRVDRPAVDTAGPEWITT